MLIQKYTAYYQYRLSNQLNYSMICFRKTVVIIKIFFKACFTPPILPVSMGYWHVKELWNKIRDRTFKLHYKLNGNDKKARAFSDQTSSMPTLKWLSLNRLKDKYVSAMVWSDWRNVIIVLKTCDHSSSLTPWQFVHVSNLSKVRS